MSDAGTNGDRAEWLRTSLLPSEGRDFRSEAAQAVCSRGSKRTVQAAGQWETSGRTYTAVIPLEFFALLLVLHIDRLCREE